MARITVRRTGLVVFCAMVSAWAGVMGAQETGPVVLLQPGMASGDFVSAPAGEPATTGFNLRFAGVVPTSKRWLTLIVGGSVTPYGTNGASRRNSNTPVLFIGNVFPVLGASRTAHWLSIDAPILLTYTSGGGGEHNARPYGRDVVIEGALTVHLGRKLLSGFGGPLARLRIYGLLDQVLTPNRDQFGQVDRFNPVAYYGITLPFGTTRESP